MGLAGASSGDPSGTSTQTGTIGNSLGNIVFNAVLMDSNTFFKNSNKKDCEINKCEIKAKGCKDPYTGGKMKFDSVYPFDLKVVNSNKAGWRETVCIICENSK